MAPPNKKRDGKKAEASMAFAVNGVDYRLSFGDVTSRHELEMFQASRLTMGDLKDAMSSGAPPRFVLAAFMFLAQKQVGNSVDYEKLLAELDEEVAVTVATEDDPPEA